MKWMRTLDNSKFGYFSPLANLARLTEEVGELAREINHYHGEKKRKKLKKIIQLKFLIRRQFICFTLYS